MSWRPVDLSRLGENDPALGAAVPVPRRTIRAAVRRGELKASRVAHRLLVRRSEFDRWIETHTVKPKTNTQPNARLIDRLGPRRKAANE